MCFFGTELWRSCIQVPPSCLVCRNCLENRTVLTLSTTHKPDCLAFLLIVSWANKSKALRPNATSILDTIEEGSKLYFLLICSSHFALVMTLNLGRVSAAASLSGLLSTKFTGYPSRRTSNLFQPRKLSPSCPENCHPSSHFSPLQSAVLSCMFYFWLIVSRRSD